MPKPRKSRPVGRPKLAKGEAKGKIVPVRFDVEDLKLVSEAAEVSEQTLSEWIRCTLRTGAEKTMCDNTLHEAMKTVLLEQPEHKATTAQVSKEIARMGLYTKRNGGTATASQIHARARKYPSWFTFSDPHTIQFTHNR